MPSSMNPSTNPFELADITLAHLLDAHQSGVQTLVLTVNNRQARQLLADLSAQLKDGKKNERAVLALPDIVPFAAWVRRLIEEQAFVADVASAPPLAAHGVDGFGSLLLWQAVIRELEADHYLLNGMQAARLAREADQLMSDWLLTVPPFAHTPDYRRFALWHKAYRARLLALDAQDDIMGLEQVCASLADGLTSGQGLPKNIQAVVLAGFTEIHPRLRQMLAAFQAAGIQVQRLQPTPCPPPALRRLCASSPQQEWQWAVAWARQQLQMHPQGRFAIVAPQLQGQLAFAHRLLHSSLEPYPYNIALARPLIDWPAVRAALAWLQVMVDTAQGRCTPAQAGAALVAGHCVAHGHEANGRCSLDAQWRHAGVLRLSDTDFMQALHHHTPHLAAAWSAVHAHLQILPPHTSIQHWVQHIKHLLTLLGFPGVTTLDSTQHQTLQAFEQALNALARQQVVLPQATFAQAVQTLQALLAQTGFQPQREAAARLDVLGLLEAQGGHWDAVWVLGLTDDQLPSAPKPNPFIPLAVQRQAATPRATPERELEWARVCWQQLQCCTPDLTVSSAAFEGECELRPSPLIAALTLADPAAVAQTVQAGNAAVLECLIDDHAPPLTAQDQPTPGGVGVLETQARNPLWAFVKYRLHARQLPAHARDFSNSQQALRGTFLHACVELFCTQMHNQPALQQLMQTQQIADALTPHIQHAARRYLRDWPAALRTLECERALDVLLTWAQLEAERDPYEIVALEHKQSWEHARLRLNVKLDRVDRLASGACLIMDYKTGMGTLRPQRDWLRSPPVNLQLPLYAAMLGEQGQAVAALVLMRLHARKVQALGLGDSDTGLAGVTTLADAKDANWHDLLALWRKDIAALAGAYSDGWAANVTRHAEDLQYCDVLPFLRLNEPDWAEQEATL